MCRMVDLRLCLRSCSCKFGQEEGARPEGDGVARGGRDIPHGLGMRSLAELPERFLVAVAAHIALCVRARARMGVFIIYRSTVCM